MMAHMNICMYRICTEASYSDLFKKDNKIQLLLQLQSSTTK